MNRTYWQARKAARFVFPLVAILLVGLSAAGCTSIQNLISPKTTTTTTTTQEKGTAAKDLKVYPNDAPGYDLKDLPRYPGSLRQSFSIVEGETGKSSGVILYQTADEARQVEAFIEEQIEKYDWKLDELIITNDGQIYRLSKGTKKTSVNVATREGINFTDITYLYREY
ncbi:MAG: hypothetical protein WC891_04745 [Actinomycetota bacterium]